jgi:hypothetical protein
MATQQGVSVSNIIKTAIINYVRQNQTTNPDQAPEELSREKSTECALKN